MKKLLLLFIGCFFLFGFNPEARASHAAGGEIWYEYAGNAQFPHRYNVYLMLYRDVSGIAAPANAPICIRSGCFTTINKTATKLPFVLQPGSDTTMGTSGSIITPELTDCINLNSPGTMVITEAHRYYTQVDLPGPCGYYIFLFTKCKKHEHKFNWTELFLYRSEIE